MPAVVDDLATRLAAARLDSAVPMAGCAAFYDQADRLTDMVWAMSAVRAGGD
jgi:hypothetical protein